MRKILTNSKKLQALTHPQGLTNLHFTDILVKPTGSSSPLEGEQAKMF
jgi:hypothetical protein